MLSSTEECVRVFNRDPDLDCNGQGRYAKFQSMGKTYRAYLLEQDLLLPPSLRDWLAEDHLAYFVCAVVEQLDLSAIESVYEAEERC